jgi:hypothetical protein
MTQRIENDYFHWLTSQIELPTDNPYTYNELFTRMYETEFVWHIPHDDDRVQDGLNLRSQFMHETRQSKSLDSIIHRGASVLEVLIALSKRVAFTAGGAAEIWAWQLIENLKLNRASDPFSRTKVNRVEGILEALIWRTYRRNGEGGFFPVSDGVKQDQTKIDIWNQMNIYVNEIQQL